ncbi:hypothetical protein QVD17_29314 [Tagetes erecta]|uniref:Uncharacterized protein n=1 Tax=Tagetes erecta TaxID=13708 RepID=A0AAD8KHU8_TARER|nr:hypothetical protein QVD17_29314 [Tagetes erecta]
MGRYQGLLTPITTSLTNTLYQTLDRRHHQQHFVLFVNSPAKKHTQTLTHQPATHHLIAATTSNTSSLSGRRNFSHRHRTNSF